MPRIVLRFMKTRLATMDTTSSVPQLSLGEFRTVTRQVGRSRNGTNRKVRKATYVDPNQPKLSTKSGRVPHSSRPSVSGSHGVHVTVKLRPGIPNLRQEHVIEVLERCFCKAKDRFGFVLTAYTVMSNHLHFLVYVRSDEALRRGMQGLNIRLARAINRLFDRKGKVFADRFHARAVRGFNAIKKALRYVVQNARKHHVPIPAGQWDRYSSGHYRHANTSTRQQLPILHAAFPFMIMCATLQLRPSEFPGPHNRTDLIY